MSHNDGSRTQSEHRQNMNIVWTTDWWKQPPFLDHLNDCCFFTSRGLSLAPFFLLLRIFKILSHRISPSSWQQPIQNKVLLPWICPKHEAQILEVYSNTVLVKCPTVPWCRFFLGGNKPWARVVLMVLSGWHQHASHLVFEVYSSWITTPLHPMTPCLSGNYPQNHRN